MDDIDAVVARIKRERQKRGGIANETDPQNGEGEKKKPKQADILLGLVKAATLFHTPPPDNDAFANITIDDHRETHRVRGRGFREWLRYQYFEKMESGCNSEAMQVAIETIAAKAQYQGDERQVYVRVAEHAGAIYVDLGGKEWKAVKVTKLGWEIIDEPPVCFARSTSTKALPVPMAGGSIELFRRFCNLVKPKAGADNEFVVLVGHILAVLRPNASYPVFVALGEHGTCKSTLSTLIGRLTDPRAPEQRSPPTSEDDLIVGAKRAHVLAFDNISALPDWLSDAFCRLATGGGAGKRKLYSDDDEVLFDGKRPIFLTGIEDFVTRPDLVDRSNMFNLEVVNEDKRLSDSELERKFAAAAPRIFGALLDGLVAGLKNLTDISIKEKPRMADFMLWAEACTRTYWPAGTFMKAYRAKLESTVEVVLEASPVGAAVRRFMASHNEWKGTAQELLAELAPLVGERAAKEPDWPKRPNTLAGKLRRAAPALRRIGIHAAFNRDGHDHERIITIEKRGKPEQSLERPSASSGSSAKTATSNKINCLAEKAADDARTTADDPADDTHDARTILDGTIVRNNPLKCIAYDDADDADDVSAFRSAAASLDAPADDPSQAPRHPAETSSMAAGPAPEPPPAALATGPAPALAEGEWGNGSIPPALRRCAQCGGLSDERGAVTDRDLGGVKYWLHAGCDLEI